MKYFLQESIALQLSRAQCHRALNRMGTCLWSRRQVTTKRGSIGVVPRPAGRGNMVTVLLVGSAPLILRPYTDRGKGMWENVAPVCFIQGIMDGEAVQGFQEGKCLIHDISVRWFYISFHCAESWIIWDGPLAREGVFYMVDRIG